MQATAPETTTTTAANLTLATTIVTRHGANYGLVEIDTLGHAGRTPAGVDLYRVTGYQNVRGGVCGPRQATYRADDVVEVRA